MGFLLRDPLVVVHKVDLHIRVCNRMSLVNRKTISRLITSLEGKKICDKIPLSLLSGEVGMRLLEKMCGIPILWMPLSEITKNVL